MTKTPHEADEAARSDVEHVFGYLLDGIRAERALLGLPAEFEFVCLVHSHSVPFELGTQFVDGFTAGQSLVLPLGSSLVFARDREELYRAVLPLRKRGEHDASYYDYSRPDATLLHIIFYRRGP